MYAVDCLTVSAGIGIGPCARELPKRIQMVNSKGPQSLAGLHALVTGGGLGISKWHLVL